jgi:hypothetical protein
VSIDDRCAARVELRSPFGNAQSCDDVEPQPTSRKQTSRARLRWEP